MPVSLWRLPGGKAAPGQLGVAPLAAAGVPGRTRPTVARGPFSLGPCSLLHPRGGAAGRGEEVTALTHPYEVMFILRPDLDEEATAAAIDRIAGVVTGQGGRVEKVDRWGKRKLAYEIKGYQDGFYSVMEFEGTPDVVAELDRVLRISDEVIRGLIVRRDEP